MSNLIDDNAAVPVTKSNLVGLPAGADATKYWAATDANTITSWITSMRDKLSGAVANFLRFKSNSSAPVSNSGDAVIFAKSGKLYTSSDGRPARKLQFTYDVSEFGAVGDGVADDTAALQAALDFGYAEIIAGRPCTLLFGPGVYRVTSTLRLRGNGALSPSLVGAYQRSDNYSGSIGGQTNIQWDGADLGTLFFSESNNVGLYQDIVFDGGGKARCTFVYSSTTFADRSVLSAANDVIWERCRFQDVKKNTSGTILVELGTDPALTGGPTYEAAHGRFRDCYFRGDKVTVAGDLATLQSTGVKNMAGGNAKIFRFEDCSWQNCGVCLDTTLGSAAVVVTNGQAANVRQVFKTGSGELIVNGFDIEVGSDCADCRLISGGNGQVGCYASLKGVEFVAFMAGAIGTVIDFAGRLDMEGCLIINSNTSDDAQGNPYRIYIGGEFGAGPGGAIGCFRSRNNWYYNSGGASDNYIPVYDNTLNNNPVFPTRDTYGGSIPFTVSSEDDIGGPSGATVQLTAFNSRPTTFYEAKFNGPVEYGYLSSRATGDPGIDNKKWVSIDATGADKTFTPPAAAASNVGREYFVYKYDSSSHTVTANGVTLRKQGEYARMVSNGFEWENIVVPASSTLPGYMTAGAQTLAGAKTFADPIIFKNATGITAHAGGGQASAVVLAAQTNFVTTVATVADSVKLPACVSGATFIVYNDGANSLDIFPSSSEQIDALGADTAYALAAGSVRVFDGKATGQWRSR